MTGNTFDGMTVFIQRETFGTQCHTLIQLNVVSDDCCGTDHDTGAVVDCKMCADGGTWMDVDTGFGMCHFGDHPGYQWNTQFHQFMSDAVIADGFDGRIAIDAVSYTHLRAHE